MSRAAPDPVAPESGKQKALRFGAIIAVFLLSRAAFYAAGIRFDAAHLPYFWQFVEPALLRERLFESLLYLHAQPPLFNLFLGIVLKLFPASYTTAFAGAYMLMGLLMTLALEEFMRELGFRRIASRIFLLLFIISPAMILYETWLFYTYPVALLLIAAALFLLRFIRYGRGRFALLFFFTLAALCLTRASFHLVWFLAAAGIALLGARLVPGRTRTAWPFALAAGLLIVSLYAKNQILFGEFSPSSWMGMNLGRATIEHLPAGEKKRLRAMGKLSPAGELRPFIGPYPDEFFRHEPLGIPVLDRRFKAGNHANFNHPAYIRISRMHLADAKYFLKNHPGLYMSKVREAAFWYFAPAHANEFLKNNFPHILKLAVFYGRYLQPYKFGLPLSTMLPTFLAIVFGLFLLARLLMGRSADPARDAAAAFLGMTLLFGFAAAAMLEYGENNRFRFPMEAPAYVLFGLLISPRLRRGLARLKSLKKA